ncbi:precorrin-3B synthase [Mycoplana dimorpha]|uniref:Precorrin-3B synthase n=1 Tax=Mycoplana dimorpha TaxID=28320 RepID=A0A2T5BB16_MYCDI|nr:precorrin-3B synthase [Mycoplana dimorpha]PTM96167.1 precorrin-3B synthase [Mycoplana dimorpha]
MIAAVDAGCDTDRSTAASGSISALRRGACPSLTAPMRTGDGLLVRLRPARPGIAPSDWIEIARLAAAHGNGLLEVTARGNLQVRGLTEQSVPKLAAGLAEAGIDLHSGVAVETPALSGIDPGEIADANPPAAAIRAAITACRPPLLLAPKLSIVVNGGGRLDLSAMVADVRLDAVRRDGALFWRLAAGGTLRSARPIAVVADRDAVAAVLAVLEALHGLGPAVRGRDVDVDAVRRQLGSMALPAEAAGATAPPASPIGRRGFGDTEILGLGLAYGQTSAARLEALMRGLQALGATEVRLAPQRALLVLGLAAERIEPAGALAAAEGFWTHADEPGNAIAVCAGAAGCASGHFDTKAAADLLVARGADLLDGSAAVHISGCGKGCAHPSAAALTLVGRADGVALVIGGRAGDATGGVVPADALGTAIDRLTALYRQEKRQGDPARDVLDRIGAAALAKAFQQDLQ